MESIEVKNKISLIYNAKMIGFGVNARCFLMPNKEVLKLYKNNDRTKFLINQKVSNLTFTEKLIKISEITNDTFIGPNKLVYNNGQLIGYFIKYIDAPSLKEIKSNIRLSQLFTNYEKVLEDIRKISEKKFQLFDLKCEDTMLGDYYHIIDLERGKFKENLSVDEIYNINVKNFFYVIIWKIFNTKSFEYPYFEDTSIGKYLFHDVNPSFLESINDFKEVIADRCEESDPTINEIRKKIRVKNDYNSYINIL